MRSLFALCAFIFLVPALGSATTLPVVRKCILDDSGQGYTMEMVVNVKIIEDRDSGFIAACDVALFYGYEYGNENSLLKCLRDKSFENRWAFMLCKNESWRNFPCG